jgi:UDP-glucose 4-epimerase
VTINWLAEMIRDLAKSVSPIVRIPTMRPEGFEDMQRRVPDCSKLSRTIGFSPTTPLEAIIADVIADQRSRQDRVTEGCE